MLIIIVMTRLKLLDFILILFIFPFLDNDGVCDHGHMIKYDNKNYIY